MKRTLYATLFALLLTTGFQAQNVDESKNTSIADEKNNLSTTDNKPKDNPISNPSAIAAIEKVFYDNAKRAELTDEKTQELVKIINDRNKDLKDLEARKKQASPQFSIEEPVTLFNSKIKEVRNQYAQKISELLTYKQFCYFVVDNYRDEAIEKSKPEYYQLSKSNPDLTKEQKTKLYKMIYSYHLNQLLTNAYLSFDSNKLKPKLGILRFNFEKEFAKTCKEFNVKTTESKSPNSNDFQWN